MIVPETVSYKAVTSDTILPELDNATIDLFCERFEARKLKAISRDCYEAGHLQYVLSASTPQGTYIRSETKTAFNIVPYTQNILLSNDGDIVESSCECPTGMGPTGHCHHIVTVLIGLEDFSCRKEIVTVHSRAMILQAIHGLMDRTDGTLFKAEYLPCLSTQPKLRNTVEFDPRHRSTIEVPGYVDMVRNLTVAQQLQCTRMPISQLFPCANPYGIDNDHDYTKRDCLEYYNIDYCDNML